MANSTSYKASPVASTEICPRCGCPPVACTCCELVCFERPDYHCGHLLTDADLSLQVKYVVEKNKLRNRALHGNGVVCGLKLTCDHHCCGQIIVHKGYAIDDCGNDIVVCETLRFDVIEALRAKRLIWHERRRDPCEPWEEDECRIRQCFYVTICYEEEECEFETPYQSGCATGPQNCMPTRKREGFRIEVTDCLPEDRGYLDWLEKRLKHCFRLFREGRIGHLIRQEMELLRRICECSQPDRDQWDWERCDPCHLFRLLKGYFIEQIKLCPDELDCRLLKEVECLCCPDRECGDFCERLRDCYCRLFELMLRYQYDCVLSDLVFDCCEPECSRCVVLGTVEIVDGCLVRVCNTPRKHVWSFANLLPLAIGSIMTGALMQKPRGDDGERERSHCCPDYGDFFCCETFLREMETNTSGRFEAATAILRAAKAGFGALSEGFAFADSGAFAPEIFQGMKVGQAMDFAAALGVHASRVDADAPADLDPTSAFLAQMLLRRQDSVKLYADSDGNVRRAAREAGPARRAPAPEDVARDSEPPDQERPAQERPSNVERAAEKPPGAPRPKPRRG